MENPIDETEKKNKLNDHAILLDEKDNVVTALRDIPKGSYIWSFSGSSIALALKEDVKPGFKICISAVLKGEKIYKYGCAIGDATADINVGDIVHVSNMSGLM